MTPADAPALPVGTSGTAPLPPRAEGGTDLFIDSGLGMDRNEALTTKLAASRSYGIRPLTLLTYFSADTSQTSVEGVWA